MKKTIVRTLAEADPAYFAASELLTKLKATLVALDAEDDSLRFRLANRKPGAETTSRVAALLGEDAQGGAAAPDGMDMRLKAIASERIDLRAAVEIAQARVAKARHAASRLICSEVRAEYSARVERLSKAMIEIAAANASLVEITDSLEANDVAWSGDLIPMQITHIIGHQGDRVSAWLREAVAAGFIDKKTIPKELQA